MAGHSSAPRRISEDLAGGIALLALAGLALYLTWGIDRGTLRSMGPGMLPRALAVMLGLCGLALTVRGLRAGSVPVAAASLKGPLLVALALLLFAATIQPVDVGPVRLPGLGIALAGPLTIIVGGMAAADARLRELVLLALFLTPFSILIFGDLLNLPLPVLPQPVTLALIDMVSARTIMRVVSALMIVSGLGLLLLWRRRPEEEI